jgi:hypothetical protein
MLKPALVADCSSGTVIENIVQVFHRILDLKHGLGFYPGFFLFRIAGLYPIQVNFCIMNFLK